MLNRHRTGLDWAIARLIALFVRLIALFVIVRSSFPFLVCWVSITMARDVLDLHQRSEFRGNIPTKFSCNMLPKFVLVLAAEFWFECAAAI